MDRVGCDPRALESPRELESEADQGELGLALAAFGQTARMKPGDPVAAEGRIDILIRLGRDEEARRVREEWENAPKE